MGYEEFFENNRTNFRNVRRESQLNDEYSDKSEFPFKGNSYNTIIKDYIEKIRLNKKMKLFIVLAGFLILTLIIALIVILGPFIKTLFDFVIQNGLQGVIDKVSGFIDTIIKGTAK